MKLNLKKLAALTSSLLVVSCNGGGSSGGYVPPDPQTNYCTQDGVPEYNRTTSYSINEQVQYNNNRYLKISKINDVNPSEYPSVWELLGSCNEPYTPPEILQPLKFKSIGTPLNLNKVGGNAVWYMLVTNPNSEKVTLNTIDNNTNSIFVQNGQMGAQNYNTNIIHPMDYAENYNQEVSGYTTTPDCLSLLNGTSLSLLSGQSCVYKFRAFWNSNLDMPQVNNFKIDYVFYSTKRKSYCTSALGQCDYSIPYNSNNTLSYQSTNLSSQDVVESMLGFNFVFSGDGSTVLTWVQPSLAPTQSVSTYSVNYNSTTNKLSLSNQQNYSGWGTSGSFYFNFPNGGWISENGQNFGANLYNNMLTLGWNFNGVNGTNGNIYTFNGNNNNVFKSPTGDFINPSNYSQLSNAWSTMSYNLIAFDENNNIAVLYKPRTRQNFCYNMSNGVYTELSIAGGVPTLYNFGTWQTLNSSLPVFNGKIYINASWLYGYGQNGQMYLNKNSNVSTLRELNSINCSVSDNQNFYSFNTITNGYTNNYSFIRKNINATFLVSNSNL